MRKTCDGNREQENLGKNVFKISLEYSSQMTNWINNWLDGFFFVIFSLYRICLYYVNIILKLFLVFIFLRKKHVFCLLLLSVQKKETYGGYDSSWRFFRQYSVRLRPKPNSYQIFIRACYIPKFSKFYLNKKMPMLRSLKMSSLTYDFYKLEHNAKRLPLEFEFWKSWNGTIEYTNR